MEELKDVKLESNQSYSIDQIQDSLTEPLKLNAEPQALSQPLPSPPPPPPQEEQTPLFTVSQSAKYKKYFTMLKMVNSMTGYAFGNKIIRIFFI